MPDKPARWPAELLSSKRLTEIERRHPVRAGGRPSADYGEVEELLAHIDALTAAVETKIEAASYHRNYRQACIDIIAILRGEQPDPDAEEGTERGCTCDGYGGHARGCALNLDTTERQHEPWCYNPGQHTDASPCVDKDGNPATPDTTADTPEVNRTLRMAGANPPDDGEGTEPCFCHPGFLHCPDTMEEATTLPPRCRAIWNGCWCGRAPHADHRHVWMNTLDHDRAVDPARYPTPDTTEATLRAALERSGSVSDCETALRLLQDAVSAALQHATVQPEEKDQVSEFNVVDASEGRNPWKERDSEC